MLNVLVVEPDPIYRKLFPIWLRKHFAACGLHVRAVTSAKEAEAIAQDFLPDVLLTVLELDEEDDGLTLARRLSAESGHLRVVVIARIGYSGLRRRLRAIPGSQYLAKPVGEAMFTAVVDGVLACPEATSGGALDLGRISVSYEDYVI